MLDWYIPTQFIQTEQFIVLLTICRSAVFTLDLRVHYQCAFFVGISMGEKIKSIPDDFRFCKTVTDMAHRCETARHFGHEPRRQLIIEVFSNNSTSSQLDLLI